MLVRAVQSADIELITRALTFGPIVADIKAFVSNCNEIHTYVRMYAYLYPCFSAHTVTTMLTNGCGCLVCAHRVSA